MNPLANRNVYIFVGLAGVAFGVADVLDKKAIAKRKARMHKKAQDIINLAENSLTKMQERAQTDLEFVEIVKDLNL